MLDTFRYRTADTFNALKSSYLPTASRGKSNKRLATKPTSGNVSLFQEILQQACHVTKIGW